jgi:hypothetical protein
MTSLLVKSRTLITFLGRKSFLHMSVFPAQSTRYSVIYNAGHEIVSESYDIEKLLVIKFSI